MSTSMSSLLSSLLPNTNLKGTTSKAANLDGIFTAVRTYSPNSDRSIKSQKDMAIMASKALEEGKTNWANFFSTFALDKAAFDKLAALDGKDGVGAVDFAKLAEASGDLTGIDANDFTKAGITHTVKDYTISDLDTVAGKTSTDRNLETLIQLLLLLFTGGLGTAATTTGSSSTTSSSTDMSSLLSGLISSLFKS